ERERARPGDDRLVEVEERSGPGATRHRGGELGGERTGHTGELARPGRRTRPAPHRHPSSCLSQKRADVLVRGYDEAVRLCPDDLVQLDPPELTHPTAPANPPWRGPSRVRGRVAASNRRSCRRRCAAAPPRRSG